MNNLHLRLKCNELVKRLCVIANTLNFGLRYFSYMEVSTIREEILKITIEIKNEDACLYNQLVNIKENLFYPTPNGQAMINPVVLGQAIFGLNYIVGNQQKEKTVSEQESEIWTYIHPLIQKSSKQLFVDGHYANAAEDAYIEINDRVKKLFALTKPGTKIPDGSAVMNTVFSANDPLVKFCDIGTETGENKQKGYMQMLAGAMSALRNPKAHSNGELVSAEEAYRRLATASMLMYAIDEGVKYSGIEEYKRDNNG